MAEQRFVSAQVCDDVRQEVGNKYSLIGCYGSSMYLSTFPVLLPKLCAFVRVYTPIDKPLAKLSIRVSRADQLLTEIEIPPQALASIRDAEQPTGSRYMIVGTAVVISPFAVEEPCILRLEAETEEGVLNGGTFRIEKPPTAK